MDLLVVNPNTSPVVLDVIMRSAQRCAHGDTTLAGMHAPGGARNIDCAYGDYMSAPHMIEAVRTRMESASFDAVVLAGFGNVGVFALKEILDIPVISISEASMAMACLLGHRFTTLTTPQQFVPYQEDLVRLYGFEAKCASVRAINASVEQAAVERERTLQALREQTVRIIEEDRAEVIILGCGGLCGYDEALSEAVGVPVIDPVVAGVKMAESLVAMGLSQSKIRKFHVPPQPLDAYQGGLFGARSRAVETTGA